MCLMKLRYFETGIMFMTRWEEDAGGTVTRAWKPALGMGGRLQIRLSEPGLPLAAGQVAITPNAKIRIAVFAMDGYS